MDLSPVMALKNSIYVTEKMMAYTGLQKMKCSLED